MDLDVGAKDPAGVLLVELVDEGDGLGLGPFLDGLEETKVNSVKVKSIKVY